MSTIIIPAFVGFVLGFLLAAVLIGGVMITIHRGLAAENRELRHDNETLMATIANANERSAATAVASVADVVRPSRPRTMWDVPESSQRRGPHNAQ